MGPVGYVGLGGGFLEGLRPGALGRGLAPWSEGTGRLQERKGHGFWSLRDLGLKPDSGQLV